MKIKIKLSYRQFIWLHQFVGQSTATEMSIEVWEQLDKEFRMLEEQVNDQRGCDG